MEHIDFVLWVLLYPICTALAQMYHQKASGRKWSNKVMRIAAVSDMLIWVSIGILLY